MKLIKSALSVLLSAALCTMFIPSAAVAQTKAANHQGVISLVTTKAFGWPAGVATAVEKATLFGLGVAAKNTDDPAASEFMTLVKKICSGGQARHLSEIKSLCKEISQQIAELQDSMNDSTDYLDARIKELENQIDDMQFDDKHREMVEYYNKYQTIYQDFVDLNDTVAKYADGEATLEQVQQAYDYIESYYRTDSNPHTNSQFSFVDDMESILTLASPYHCGTAVDYDVDPSDSSKWGSNAGTKTYLDYVWDDITGKYGFENTVRDYLTAGMNDTANTMLMYLAAYKMYVEFGAQYYNTDLSDADRTSKVSNLWSGFSSASYKMQRGLCQMASLYEYPNGDGVPLYAYMLDYDVESTVYLKWSESTDHKMYDDNTWTSNTYGKVGSSFQAYQFRPLGSSYAYAVRQVTSDQPTLQNWMMTDKYYKKGLHQCHLESQDYLNLISCSSPSGYNLPVTESGKTYLTDFDDCFEPITKTEAWTSGDHIVSFLKSQGLTNLPNVNETGYDSSDKARLTGNFALTGWYNDMSAVADGIIEYDTEFRFLNVSLPWENDNVTLDRSGKLHDLDAWDNFAADNDDNKHANDELLAMYVGYPVVALRTVAENAGSGDDIQVYETFTRNPDGKGYGTSTNLVSSLSSDNRVTPHSGGGMTIRVKAGQGRTLESLKIVSKYDTSKVLTELIAPVDRGDDVPALTVQEQLSYMQPNEDGYYEFKTVIPYQDANIVCTFADEDPALVQHTATLSQAEDGQQAQGELNFSSFTGLPTQSAVTGQTLEVTALPNEGVLCSGIKVLDASGNDITSSVGVKDITEINTEITPSARTFSFNMPSGDVTVRAVYSTGNTVQVSGANGQVAFVMDGEAVSSNSGISTYSPGDRVYLKCTPDSGYYFSNAEVYGLSSYEYLDCIPTDDGLAFIMPKAHPEDVKVEVAFSEKKGVHTARINTNIVDYPEAQALAYAQFDDQVDSAGKSVPINSLEHQFDAGSSVGFTVTTKTSEIVVTKIAVSDYDGNSLSVTKGNEIKTDDGTTTVRYSFDAVDKNMYVDVSFDSAAKIAEAYDNKALSKAKGAVKYVKLRGGKKTKKTYTVKLAATKSKSGARMTFKKKYGSKYITVSKGGTIALKKGVKKGTYTTKVTVKVGTATKNVTVKFIVKK